MTNSRKIILAPPFRSGINIGSDCSGMGTDCVAMRRLKLPFQNLFASDSVKSCRDLLRADQHAPKRLLKDARNNKHKCKVHLYTAGIPCQPFSDSAAISQLMRVSQRCLASDHPDSMPRHTRQRGRRQ